MEKVCSLCGGTEQCLECGGTGRVACDVCIGGKRICACCGRSSVVCKWCRGTGKSRCRKCAGTGLCPQCWASEVEEVRLRFDDVDDGDE